MEAIMEQAVKLVVSIVRACAAGAWQTMSTALMDAVVGGGGHPSSSLAKHASGGAGERADAIVHDANLLLGVVLVVIVSFLLLVGMQYVMIGVRVALVLATVLALFLGVRFLHLHAGALAILPAQDGRWPDGPEGGGGSRGEDTFYHCNGEVKTTLRPTDNVLVFECIPPPVLAAPLPGRRPNSIRVMVPPPPPVRALPPPMAMANDDDDNGDRPARKRKGDDKEG